MGNSLQSNHLQLTNELAQWKENCKQYEQKYCQLQELSSSMESRLTQNRQELLSKEEKLAAVLLQLEEQREKQTVTTRMADKLKEKCKEVEQYYKLVEDISKENTVLKEKLEASYFSFRSPRLDHTSKREDSQQRKNSKNSTMGRFRGRECDLNDLTTKAEFQKARLEAVRQEHTRLHKDY
jgi:chromosome segregation ATPase